jgi:hypothetical protein
MHTIKRARSQPHDQKRTKLLEMGDGLHLARETHACAARPATGVPVTMFSSWRLVSEELPIADIPGIMMRLGARHRTSKNVDIAMATFLKIFIVVLLVVLLAHAFIGWLRPDVTPGLPFLPGDIKYESPGGNVRVYFPIVTSIVLSVVLTLILRLFGRFFGR